MASETVVSVKWNPSIFRSLTEGVHRKDMAKTLGISKVFLDKLITGEKKVSIDRFTELCVNANLEPNEFFEIVTKKS